MRRSLMEESVTRALAETKLKIFLESLSKPLGAKGFVVDYSKSKNAVQLNYNKYQEIMEIIENGNNEH